MNWQIQLITIYLMVCKHYESHLWIYCQRMSNHTDLSFSDEEAITLYLFGVLDKIERSNKFTRMLIAIFGSGFPGFPVTLPSFNV